MLRSVPAVFQVSTRAGSEIVYEVFPLFSRYLQEMDYEEAQDSDKDSDADSGMRMCVFLIHRSSEIWARDCDGLWPLSICFSLQCSTQKDMYWRVRSWRGGCADVWGANVHVCIYSSAPAYDSTCVRLHSVFFFFLCLDSDEDSDAKGYSKPARVCFAPFVSIIFKTNSYCLKE